MAIKHLDDYLNNVFKLGSKLAVSYSPYDISTGNFEFYGVLKGDKELEIEEQEVYIEVQNYLDLDSLWVKGLDFELVIEYSDILGEQSYVKESKLPVNFLERLGKVIPNYEKDCIKIQKKVKEIKSKIPKKARFDPEKSQRFCKEKYEEVMAKRRIKGEE